MPCEAFQVLLGGCSVSPLASAAFACKFRLSYLLPEMPHPKNCTTKIVLRLQECEAVLKQYLCYLNGSPYNPQQKAPDSMCTGDDCLDLGSHLTCSPLCDGYLLRFG